MPAPRQRGAWNNHWEYILATLGVVVGIGNVLRFPYVTYANGGGSFLLPYVLMLIIVAWPLLFLDMAIGQYCQAGINKAYVNMLPLFKGVAYATFFVRFLAMTFLITITSWASFYLFASMQGTLPWTSCTSDWNTVDCFNSEYNDACKPIPMTNPMTNETVPVPTIFWNNQCSTVMEYCLGHGFAGFGASEGVPGCITSSGNVEPLQTIIPQFAISPAEDYFNGKMLGLNKNKQGEMYTWDDFGSIQWELVLCQLLGWTLTSLANIRGVRSLGKAAYIFTLMPYIVITILLIYSATLDGSSDGIDYYLTADWSKLKDFDIWIDAISQIVASVGLGTGTHMALSSFNARDNKVHYDATIISSLNSLSSFYIGCAIFLMTGFLAFQTGVPVENVVFAGPALAFVAVPTAVVDMVAPQLWAILFFFMLLNLSLSTLAGNHQVMVAFVIDEWPKMQKYRPHLVILTSAVMSLWGLPITMNGGIHFFRLIDARFFTGLMSVAFLQCIGLSWIYGMPEFFKDMEVMKLPLNKPLKVIFSIQFIIIIPVVIATLFGYNLVNAESIAYRDYEYPEWVQSLGWFIMILPLVITGIYVIFYFIMEMRAGLSFKETTLKGIRPTEQWYLFRDFDYFSKTDDDVEGDGSDDDSSVGSSSKNSSRKSSLRKESDTGSTAKIDYD